jgi:hypothetical protein
MIVRNASKTALLISMNTESHWRAIAHDRPDPTADEQNPDFMNNGSPSSLGLLLVGTGACSAHP